MKTFRILILEDDLRTISLLLDRFSLLEEQISSDIAVTVLTEYIQVEEYVNKTDQYFDLVLLDRDCKACGSFHVLDFHKFGVDKIISISSMPEWNKDAEARGVKNIVLKDYANLDQFADKVLQVGKQLLKLN